MTGPLHFAVAELLSLVKQHPAHLPSYKGKGNGDLQHSYCSKIPDSQFQGTSDQLRGRREERRTEGGEAGRRGGGEWGGDALGTGPDQTITLLA